MGWVARGATAAVAVAAGGIAVGRAMSTRGQGNWPEVRSTDTRESRWQVVTVNRPRAELSPDGRVPEPLARLGDAVEVHLRPAPGNRGTELAARMRPGASHGLAGMAAHVTGDDPRLALRAALRQAKQVAETGELLSADQPAVPRRTLLDGPLEQAIQHARDEGRL
jgi:hypothetical protein